MFWFVMGACLGLFLLISFSLIIFQELYENVAYPGVVVENIDVGGKTEDQMREIFAKKNENLYKTKFSFVHQDYIATISAKELQFGYDQDLLAKQAFSIGRSDNLFSNASLIFQANLYGVYLSPAYHYSQETLQEYLGSIAKEVKLEPVDALFRFENGRVTAFRPSSDGQEVDFETLEKEVTEKIPLVAASIKPKTFTLVIPIKVLKPNVTTDEVNSLGINELIGVGNSLFQGSIQSRIFNITLAATRLNGILVAPDETFSFNKALGDISAFTGYKQAYVIEGGKTVLGDGGGVCQVSTTFFRALLDAGLPIVERHAHAYRVGYYEQDQGPGYDATIYSPSINLQFKNDTNHHILIQTFIDPTYQKLTFHLYGTKDGRESIISQPVITGQTPAPPPSYQDDPTLPKGQTKQVDFAAAGATVYITRIVKKEGKVLYSDKFSSYYRPWQAVYMRGTKE